MAVATATTYPVAATNELILSLEGQPNNIIALLFCYLNSVEDLESTALLPLYFNRSLGEAVGTQLDVIGHVLGVNSRPIVASDDASFTQYLRGVVQATRSNATFETLIAIASLVINAPTTTTIVTSNEGVATVRVRIASTVGITSALASIVMALETKAVAGGVRLLVQFGERGDSGLFRFDSGPGFDQGHLASDLSN